MKLNLVGPFVVNAPFGTEIAFAKGLRQLGHEVTEVDPNLGSDVYRGMGILSKRADATVVFKTACGHEDYLDDLAHPVIVYQPDDARFPHIREMMLMMRQHADLLLSFDSHGAEVAKTMGYRAAETLLLTADPDLYSPSPEPIVRDIDVSFIGSLGDPVAHASRRKMIQYVMEKNEQFNLGLKVEFGSSQDIPTVVDIYRRSKVVLNHATDVGQPFGWGYGLQCRHFEVGMAGTLLLSNMMYGWTEPGRMPFAMFEDEAEMLDKILAIKEGKGLNDPEKLGQGLLADIRERHMPVHRAAQLVDFIQRNTK
jgi:hypothetical protein